ncbi:MAG: hypothetical protein ACYDCC_10025 [Actinomycetota bacterium]
MDKEEREALAMTKDELLARAARGEPAKVIKNQRALKKRQLNKEAVGGPNAIHNQQAEK